MSKAKKVNGFIRYRSYSFKEKDPIIDKVRTIVSDSGLSYTQINEKSDVAQGTLRNWFHGDTKRPQFATLNAVARALGHELTLTPTKGASRQIPRRVNADGSAYAR